MDWHLAQINIGRAVADVDGPELADFMAWLDPINALADAAADVFKRRREWFERFPTAYMCMWWIPAGTLPTVDEAKLRLASLDTHGATPYAFSFKQRFAAPESAVPA